MNIDHGQVRRTISLGAAGTFLALASTAIGAAFAKTIIPLTGAAGIAGLRIAIAAMLVMMMRRPWRNGVPKALWWRVALYGVMLGLMNLLIYQAFSRIPIGIAVAIEVMGPLAVALFGSRQPIDFLWLIIAVAGLSLLIPHTGAERLDWTGVGFAAASGLCWALYILTGKHVADRLGGDAVAWGLSIATLIFLPAGLVETGPALMIPGVIGTVIVVAILSSAIPYSLEMAAMQLLPASLFGLISSAAPGVGALSGFFILGEKLSGAQWLAILCIMVASAGGTLAVSSRPRAVAAS